MFQTDQATAATSLPTPAVAGTQGYFTGGNPGGGVPATILDADFMNMVMLELTNVVTAAGLTPSKTTYTQVLAAIRAMTQDTSRVTGLRGNPGATVATQMAFSADAVTLRNPTTGATSVVAGGTGTITTDLTVAGPAANGRDQAGAFAASSWIHFYFIYNPTTSTLATIASLALPTVGPAFPTGYTALAYIGGMRFNGSSALVQGHFSGSWFNYQTPQVAISGGTATTAAPVTLVTIIPPNALQFKLYVAQLVITATAGGAASISLTLQIETGQTAGGTGGQFVGGASAVWSTSGALFHLSNLSQGFNYLVANNAGTGGSATIDVLGYSNPNGGE